VAITSRRDHTVLVSGRQFVRLREAVVAPVVRARVSVRAGDLLGDALDLPLRQPRFGAFSLVSCQ
jgi:hypothetical protein